MVILKSQAFIIFTDTITQIANAEFCMRKKYVPDLVKMAAVCEINYGRLSRLLRLESVEHEFYLDLASQHLAVRIKIVEERRYTTMLEIEQDSAHPWLGPQSMQVRLYHDARMAEVMGYQQQGQFAGRYTYPNSHMHQPDEKLQLNEFLAQWLENCLKYGQIPTFGAKQY